MAYSQDEIYSWLIDYERLLNIARGSVLDIHLKLNKMP